MVLPIIRGSYRENFNLAKVTWFGVGGVADILFKPADTADLCAFLKTYPANLPCFVLGVGSNILVRDAGIKGVVIRLGREFSQISHQDNQLIVGAGALDINVSKYCADNELAGLEFLSGIPGVIGGAIAMNAGAYASEIADFLIKVEAVDRQGNLRILTMEDFGFKYRSNSLTEQLIFTKAYLRVALGDANEIQAKINHIKQQRELTQPIHSRTGGSSFKNPMNFKAWQLIDAAGCRGLRQGGAIISPMHCNFMINEGDATAKDLEELGEIVRQRVFAQSGIMLDWELKIIGE